MFTHKYRYLFVFLLSVYTYLNTEFCNLYDHFGIRIEAWYAFGTILVTTLFILEVNRLLEKFIRKFFLPQKNKLRFLGFFFISGSIAATIISTAMVFAVGMGLHSFSFKENIIPLKLNLTYAWLVNLLYHLINAVIFYYKEYSSTRIETEELKRIQVQAELQLIKNQINPHFLFNNLNVLASLVMQNNSEANRFIEEFSVVYRYILQNHQKELVPLKTELYYINPYVFLLQKRFGEGLNVTIDVPAEFSEYLVVPAALQMLIENAIKHNVVSRSKPLKIVLQVIDRNAIRVTNNLQPKQTPETSTEIGLRNIIKRYSLVSERQLVISDGGADFSVIIPLIHNN
ncbi:sensor histidine kinase [Ferruginibacter sp. HRS2-29]|uniref:sensor histidine kinase n=1 Tax=Ferruginibacter sp. HRS2-29 TaxID=2487334 RepID=UPI0020CC846A|nr:histidine kinase [Ferruginibacter sp. HRS2-29]MCP9752297.1 sensor protein lytS [Ferruginibacter sp. HRS2-29]